jgi:hypothetical protein
MAQARFSSYLPESGSGARTSLDRSAAANHRESLVDKPVQDATMRGGTFHERRSQAQLAGPLLIMHGGCIIICMRTTLSIDDALLERARQATGIQGRTALVRAGLEALIAREAGKRLAALGGSQPKLSNIPRRRSA